MLQMHLQARCVENLLARVYDPLAVAALEAKLLIATYPILLVFRPLASSRSQTWLVLRGLVKRRRCC